MAKGGKRWTEEGGRRRRETHVNVASIAPSTYLSVFAVLMSSLCHPWPSQMQNVSVHEEEDKKKKDPGGRAGGGGRCLEFWRPRKFCSGRWVRTGRVHVDLMQSPFEEVGLGNGRREI